MRTSTWSRLFFLEGCPHSVYVQQPAYVSNVFLHDNPASNNDPPFVVRPAIIPNVRLVVGWNPASSSALYATGRNGSAWRCQTTSGATFKRSLYPGRLVLVYPSGGNMRGNCHYSGAEDDRHKECHIARRKGRSKQKPRKQSITRDKKRHLRQLNALYRCRYRRHGITRGWLHTSTHNSLILLSPVERTRSSYGATKLVTS